MTDSAPQSDQPASLAPPPGSQGADSISNRPFLEGTDWLSGGITTVVALVVYLWTIAPDVTLGLLAIFATGAAYAGVPHPPGFPVWTLYSWLFVKLLPVSNIAWRVAVGSAVAAALASGLVALMVSRAGIMLLESTPRLARSNPAEQRQLRLVCGSVAGMALGFSSPVWREAVIAHFWGLSVLLFAMMLCLLMRWTAATGRRRFLYGAFGAYGLLLTSNQELISLAPALLVLVMLSEQKLGRDVFLVIALVAALGWLAGEFSPFGWFDSYIRRNVPLMIAFLLTAVAAVLAIITTRRIGSEWKSAALCGMSLLLGLGFYFYLPVASMTNPPMNWGYPRTVTGFFHVINRGQYERANPTNNLGSFVAQLWLLFKATGKGLGWCYLVFTVLPFCFLRVTERSARNWMLGLTALFVCVGPLMVAMLNPPADRQSLELIEPYFCAMYVVLTVWAGLGLMVFTSIVVRPSIPPLPDAKPVS